MSGNATGIGYAARRKEERSKRVTSTKMAKVYDTEDRSMYASGRKSDYRRCLVHTVIDPEVLEAGLPGLPSHFIEDGESRKPVYPNPVRGREGTYVMGTPTSSIVGVNGLGNGESSNNRTFDDGKRHKQSLW